MNENLYEILDVTKNSSAVEIKKSFRKLARKYHPDKNKTETDDKFKQIVTAYEILSDSDKRARYDNMTNSQKKEFYDIIKTYLDEKTFNNSKLLINILYGDETEFKSIVNSFDFNTIFNKIWKRFVGHEKRTIDVTIEERYNIYKDIIISGEKFSVPLFDDDFFIQTDNYRYDITINTIKSEIYEISGHNIITTYFISLYDFLYGGTIKLKYFNNNVIDHKFNSLIGKPLKITLKNYGLGIPDVKKNDDNEYYDMNNFTRGELIIHIKIYGIDNIDDLDYSNSMRDILKHFFK